MGYETKLFIVEKSRRVITNWKTGKKEKVNGEIINGKEMFSADLIVTFDLCKCYPVSDAMRKYPDTDSYIYMDDGNTELIEDMYGEPLKEIPLADAVEILEEAANEDGYRRFAPCLALLEALYNNKDKWGEIVVLHYGH